MGAVSAIGSEIENLLLQATKDVSAASDPLMLEQLRVKYLGKKGLLKGIQNSVGSAPAEQRKALGQSINEAVQALTSLLESRKSELHRVELEKRIAGENVDVTLPGVRTITGRRHPLSQTIEELKSVLSGLGFYFQDYPELETEFYNFDSLNTPPWHPARDLQGSFYTTQGWVPRTHTTAFQVHAMKACKSLPLRAFTAGRCYRNDALDASHSPTFHQTDVIAIDSGISFADLKWTLYTIAAKLFSADTKLRFRPSYFPFTTPSAEVDISCFSCKGSGCSLCKHTGWIEILGSGMMRPEVLRAGGIDPEKYSGFAFGMGIERMAMLRHGIDDIRNFYLNEISFLEQF